ncbi:pro-adrenomedullin-like [Hyperolius riggenbachi]|uniref:pro-adrenomedullin-like n=1 Tax=Hyperolius riggenbachi TaxID=752182 RepID=UPI0035A30459
MARYDFLMLFFLAMTISICSSLWVDHRDRRMPPPVASFLEKLRDLSNQKHSRDVRDTDYHPPAVVESADNTVAENSQEYMQNILSSLLQLREKRYAPSSGSRGCPLGTCQIQNLANRIYQLGNNGSKDGSNRNTNDPLGYGRRRRRSLFTSKDRTDSPQTLQAT